MDQTHPDFEEQHEKGKNFQCLVVKKDGAPCGQFITCQKTRLAGHFKMDNAISHFKARAAHLDTAAYKKATAAKAVHAQKAIQSSLLGKRNQGGFSSVSGTSSEAEQELTQARWYMASHIYCWHVVSKLTSTDQYFRQMLYAQN
jgi:hypothetical protein